MIFYPVGFVVPVVTNLFTYVTTTKNNKEDTNTASLVVSVVSQTLKMYDSQRGPQRQQGREYSCVPCCFCSNGNNRFYYDINWRAIREDRNVVVPAICVVSVIITQQVDYYRNQWDTIDYYRNQWDTRESTNDVLPGVIVILWSNKKYQIDDYRNQWDTRENRNDVLPGVFVVLFNIKKNNNIMFATTKTVLPGVLSKQKPTNLNLRTFD